MEQVGAELELQWARLRADRECKLRRGAWYRVVSIGEERVVVRVNARPVTIARDLVELRGPPPDRWSVVRRPRTPEQLPEVFRDGYAVCPRCGHRVPLLRKEPVTLPCPKCHLVAEVAWDERYLEPDGTGGATAPPNG